MLQLTTDIWDPKIGGVVDAFEIEVGNWSLRSQINSPLM